MSGLTLWAIICINHDRLIIAGVLFIMAINFKVLALYYSIAFFAYYIGYLLKHRSIFTIIKDILLIAIAMLSMQVLL